MLVSIIVLIAISACGSCSVFRDAQETDPAQITRAVGTFEPPMLEVLGAMADEGYQVDEFVAIFSQPASTEIPVRLLEPLVGHMRRYQAELAVVLTEGSATLTQTKHATFLEGWVLGLENLLYEGVDQ